MKAETGLLLLELHALEHSPHLGLEPPNVGLFACVTREHSLEPTSVDLGVQSAPDKASDRSLSLKFTRQHLRLVFIEQFLFCALPCLFENALSFKLGKLIL